MNDSNNLSPAQWKDIERRLRRVRRFAKAMDDQFSIPGTGIRFGIDSLVGFLPGVGDAATAIAGIWLIGEATRLKVPRGVLARMLLNWTIDSTVGSVPIAGDLFDVYWKSNRKNAELLRKHIEEKWGVDHH